MPVVTIGENTADDFAGAAGAQIYSASPTTNYGEVNYGYIDETTGYRYLLSFSGLSNISAPVTVSASSIYIYAHGTSNPSPDMNGRPLLVPFVQGETTWNIRSTGNNWTTAGAGSDGNDRRAVVSFTVDPGVLSSAYAVLGSAQLASDIEDQIDGTLNNYGFVIDAISGHLQQQAYADGKRPYVSVNYTSGGGTTYNAPFLGMNF